MRITGARIVKTLSVLLSCAIFLNGCFPSMPESRWKAQQPKLSDYEYSESMRGMIRVQTELEKSRNEKEVAVLDGTFTKIRTEEDLKRYLAASPAERKSFGRATADVFVGLLALPVAAVMGILYLPLLPYSMAADRRIDRRTHAAYTAGLAAFEKKDYAEARTSFEKALRLKPLELMINSDVTYQIARSADEAGDKTAARDHYRKFLDHAVSLYPDYFARYAKAMTHDKAILRARFEDAEKRLDALR